MKISLVVLAGGCLLGLSPMVKAAQPECLELPRDQGNILVALASQASEDELLQVNFREASYCIVGRESGGLDERSGSTLQVNASLDELAVEATIDGVAAWLRIDQLISDAMMLDRATSEELGLTEAEFLGDNSLLEASDFFVEYVYSLQLGGHEIEDVEVNIPRLDAPYDHYAGRGPKPAMSDPAAGFLTVGSIGEALLEELLMTIDFANKKIYATEAR